MRYNPKSPLPIAAAIIVFLICPVCWPAQIDKDRPSEVAVCDLEIEGESLSAILSRIAYKYDVPIGFELSSKDDLLDRRILAVNVRRGTVGDVLDSLMSQKSQYQWMSRDGVIEVFPKQEHRDAVLRSVLATKIERFESPQGMSRADFGELLFTRPEVASVLRVSRLTYTKEIFSTRDVMPLNQTFALKASNVTVSSILNEAIKRSASKCWMLYRFGENKQYLILGL